jgi:hypothetical protein
VSGQREVPGLQSTSTPQLERSELLAFCTPAKVGLRLQAPVAVTCTQALPVRVWQRPPASLAARTR